MPKYIQFYRDSACKNLWAALPVTELQYSSIDAPPGNTQPIGGKTYRIFDGYGQRFRNVPMPTENPPFLSSRNTFPTATTLYCKNGLSFTLRVTNNYNGNQNITQNDIRAGGVILSSGQNLSSANPIKMYLASINYNGVTYIGFTQPSDGWSGAVIPTAFIESSFWESAIRPPYSYGQDEDPDGGQGSGGGAFRRTGVDDTTHPTGLIPTSASGRGLHAYVISAANYGDLQNYLWGDSSTTAKALWQKFQNKIHSPASCIVAVYALPADFMPTGGTAVNIRLAGITLPVTANSVQLDFAEYEVTFDPIEKPFRNFADYSHVTCKMYVPYCGELPIPVEAAYGRAIKCRYWVDQFNGNLVARVSCGDINIGELSSNVAYRIPIIGGDDGSLDRIGAALTGIAQVSAGNYSGALGSAAEMATAPYTAQIINADFSGSISACTFRRPYIEWTANENYYSDEFLRTRGVPARYAAALSSFSGGYLECMTKVSSVNIPSATDAEREEIESILRGGLFA